MSLQCNTRKLMVAAAVLAGILLDAPCTYAQQAQMPLEPMPPLLEPLPLDLDHGSNSDRDSSGITFHDGFLSVRTNNLSLAEVLEAIATKMGASIDIPPGSGMDRIVGQAGPGPADKILSDLLNGSPFNFIIVNSPVSPHVPIRIVLLARDSTMPVMNESPTVAAAVRPEQPQLYGAGFSVNPGDDEDSGSQTTAVAAVPAGDGDGNAGDRIPGEVLDQMQKERLRQRQLQMQQQTSSPSPMQ